MLAAFTANSLPPKTDFRSSRYLVCWVCCFILLSGLTVLHTKSSQILHLDTKLLTAGTFTHSYLNSNHELTLLPQVHERTTLSTALTWANASWAGNPKQPTSLWLGGSGNGALIALDAEFHVQFSTNLPYPELTALAASSTALYIAAGPYGGLYQLSPTTGEPNTPYQLSKRADIAEPFIWDLLVDKTTQTLYLAAGGTAAGVVYSLSLSTPQAKPVKLFTVQEANAVTLALQGTTLFVSSSPNGKLYGYTLEERQLHILYDSGFNDIATYALAAAAAEATQAKLYIAVTASGTRAAAAGTGAERANPQTLSAPCQASTSATNRGQTTRVGAQPLSSTIVNNTGTQAANSAAPCLSALYELTLSFNTAKRAPTATGTPSKSVLTLSSVRRLKALANETLTQLTIDDTPTGRRLLYGTLHDSAIYALKLPSLETALLHRNPQNKLAQLFKTHEQYYFTTIGSHHKSQLFELGRRASPTGYFISKSLALGESVTWGKFQYTLLSAAEAAVSIHTRSGHTQNPPAAELPTETGQQNDAAAAADKDAAEQPAASWTAWMPLDENRQIRSPSAPFLQVRITLRPANHAVPRMRALKFFYTPFNTPPEVSPLKLQLKPAPLPQQRSGQPAPMNTSPFAFLNNITVQSRQYILSWDVVTNDNDLLRYTLMFKPVNAPNAAWTTLAKNFFSNFFIISNRKFPDGLYEFKLRYDDFLSNGPEAGFIREQRSPYHVIDNTPPVIHNISRQEDIIQFTVSDKLSEITRVFYSFDHDSHYELNSRDGVLDALNEDFLFEPKTIQRPAGSSTAAAEPREPTLIAIDAAGNIAFVYPK